MSQSSGLAQPVKISEGGTGGTTVNEAKSNLGLAGTPTFVNSGGFSLTLDFDDFSSDQVIEVIEYATTSYKLTPLLIKATSGDPAGVSGIFCLNLADNNLKVYANSGWRTVTTW